MTTWQSVALILLAIIVWQTVAYFMGNPKFWRLIGRHPDLALTLFHIESGCLVDEPPSRDQKKLFDGPFRFMTSDGIKHKIYIRSDELDAIQKRVAQPLWMKEGVIPPS